MANFSIQRWQDSIVQDVLDEIAEEEPLQITVDGFPVAVVMRTPGDDEDLVRGFLITEGLVDTLDALKRVDLDSKKNHALVFLKDGHELDRARLSRNMFSASSCGICGKASIEAVKQGFGPVVSDFSVPRETLLNAPEKLRAAQQVFGETGGLHAAGLVSRSGEVYVVREDVGRHNAIDKVIGRGLVEELNFEELFLQVSGRVSFEVIQKALAVGIPLVAAISAPTSLAVEFARESGQGLVGFLRPPDFNVYSGQERVG